VSILPDGTCDVIVVDADATEDGEVRIEVTITLGMFVGHVVALRGHHVAERGNSSCARDPITLLGVPGTMRVREGAPTFVPESM